MSDLAHAKAIALAKRFHETYERLAPLHDYATRKDSSVPWEAVPAKNRSLMIAVCKELVEASRQEASETFQAGFRAGLKECHTNEYGVPPPQKEERG
jgi:hypothetical protein